jgi:hypothetical protein
MRRVRGGKASRADRYCCRFRGTYKVVQATIFSNFDFGV